MSSDPKDPTRPALQEDPTPEEEQAFLEQHQEYRRKYSKLEDVPPGPGPGWPAETDLDYALEMLERRKRAREAKEQNPDDKGAPGEQDSAEALRTVEASTQPKEKDQGASPHGGSPSAGTGRATGKPILIQRLGEKATGTATPSRLRRG